MKTHAAAARVEDFDLATMLRDARKVVEAEGRAVLSLVDQLNGGLTRALELLLACRGRVVVTGMGKSGIVGQKISATLASTGTPSLFLHAAEAVHGDLGRITPEDVVLALSNSGESEEIVRLIRPVKAIGAVLIAMTGDETSSLARHADAVVSTGRVAEACPMGLIPTASTTAMMVLGDAIAICLFNRRGFTPEAYAKFHPGGQLGRKLLRVAEIMRKGDANPVVTESQTVRDALAIMTRTRGRPGATSVVDAEGRLVGFFTDGDLRRMLESKSFSIDVSIADVMHRSPKSVGPDDLVARAENLLRTHQIDQVPVVDAEGRAVGLLDIQDLLVTRGDLSAPHDA